MTQPALNPFIYPGPVPVEGFVDREPEVHTLLSRLATGQNTAVVGEPHIGKSSLLKYLAEDESCRRRLGRWAERIVLIFHDCHLLSGGATPASFWAQVLSEAWAGCPDAEVRQVVDWAATKGELGSYALDRLFRVVTRRRWRVALLIDEFDSLLHHPGFNTAEFFGALRSLATRYSGLALVTASRLSLAAMNRQSEELNPYGSPFFNGFIEVHLRPFDDVAVATLLALALAGSGVELDGRDRGFLHALAGRHPFLLQAAAGALYDAIAAGLQGPARYQTAARTFHGQTEAHCHDLWRHLDGRARIATTALCLAELQARLAGRPFDGSRWQASGDLGPLEPYGDELSRLVEWGLVEQWRADGWQADWGNWVSWRGERWRVSNRRLVWWVSDQLLARQDVDWGAWLEGQPVRDLPVAAEGWTAGGPAEIESLESWSARIPRGAIDTAAKMLGLLLKELL